jgi:hydrogenase nickel incorporation protein HypA/HybF
MHEFGITKALVDLCNAEAEKNKLTKIYKIHLKVGKFTGFSPDSISFYFEHLKTDTKCQDADIIFDEVPIRIKCTSCGHENTIEEPILVCPDCGKMTIEVISGREFFVASIEGD